MPSLCIGFARRDITPVLGTPLFGYPDERLGFEVADALTATALVLQSRECFAALVSVDWCLIDEEEVSAIRAAISKKTGIAPQDITISATHTHSAPTTVAVWGWGQKNQEYLDAVRGLIVEAVDEAVTELQPVKVGFGTAETATGVNRREITLQGTVALGMNEWGPYDSELTVIRFEGESRPVAQIVHLSAHPTARGHNPDVSRDWPGVMLDRVEEVTGTPTLFINGAFGDVAPRTSVGGSIGDGEIAAREVGLRAAGDAIGCIRAIKEFCECALEVLNEEVELPYAPLPTQETASREFAKWYGHQHSKGKAGCQWNYWNAVTLAHESTLETGRKFQQTITRIGPLVIVPFAGEIFSEIALRLKKYSPFAYTLCAGTSNGNHGYYVTREARGRGGYEVWVAQAYGAYIMADNIDDVLVQENLRLINKLFYVK